MKKKSPPRINIGERYGRWEVLDVERVGNYYRGICQCDCGNTGSIRQDTLLNGQSSSCGCYSKELVRKIKSKKGGITKHPLYQRWYDLNRRCYDPKRKDFHHYGGRGVTVCEDWNKYNPDGFINFLRDMESSYIEGLEIDRINNDGNYCKENCKWSTRSEQVINRREVDGVCFATRFLEDGDDILHLAAMAKKYNMSPKKLQDRIGKLGWSLEDALLKEHKVKSYAIVIEGVHYKVSDIFFTNVANRCKCFGASYAQMLRSLFKEEVKVMAKINGTMETVIYDKLVVDAKPFKIKSEKFIDYFKDNYNIEVIE